MQKPKLLGTEVITPDGRGSILTLHNGGVTVRLNRVSPDQDMVGNQKESPLNFTYPYNAVGILEDHELAIEEQPEDRKNMTDKWLLTPATPGWDLVTRRRYQTLKASKLKS